MKTRQRYFLVKIFNKVPFSWQILEQMITSLFQIRQVYRSTFIQWEINSACVPRLSELMLIFVCEQLKANFYVIANKVHTTELVLPLRCNNALWLAASHAYHICVLTLKSFTFKQNQSCLDCLISSTPLSPVYIFPSAVSFWLKFLSSICQIAGEFL